MGCFSEGAGLSAKKAKLLGDPWETEQQKTEMVMKLCHLLQSKPTAGNIESSASTHKPAPAMFAAPLVWEPAGGGISAAGP